MVVDVSNACFLPTALSFFLLVRYPWKATAAGTVNTEAAAMRTGGRHQFFSRVPIANGMVNTTVKTVEQGSPTLLPSEPPVQGDDTLKVVRKVTDPELVAVRFLRFIQCG